MIPPCARPDPAWLRLGERRRGTLCLSDYERMSGEVGESSQSSKNERG